MQTRLNCKRRSKTTRKAEFSAKKIDNHHRHAEVSKFALLGHAPQKAHTNTKSHCENAGKWFASMALDAVPPFRHLTPLSLTRFILVALGNEASRPVRYLAKDMTLGKARCYPKAQGKALHIAKGRQDMLWSEEGIRKALFRRGAFLSINQLDTSFTNFSPITYYTYTSISQFNQTSCCSLRSPFSRFPLLPLRISVSSIRTGEATPLLRTHLSGATLVCVIFRVLTNFDSTNTSIQAQTLISRTALPIELLGHWMEALFALGLGTHGRTRTSTWDWATKSQGSTSLSSKASIRLAMALSVGARPDSRFSKD